MKVTKIVPWSTMTVPLPLNRFTTGTPSQRTGCIATSSETFLLAQKPHEQPNSPRHARTNEGKLLIAAPRARITSEAGMVMKKASGDDSPLRQGAGKSFCTLLISGRRRRLAVCFVEKCFCPLGFS
jgi:hypothetical protein